MVSVSKFMYIDSKNISEKFLHRPSYFFYFFSDFSFGPPRQVLKKKIAGTMEELFAYIFGIWIQKPAILTPSNSVDVATQAESLDSLVQGRNIFCKILLVSPMITKIYAQSFNPKNCKIHNSNTELNILLVAYQEVYSTSIVGL